MITEVKSKVKIALDSTHKRIMYSNGHRLTYARLVVLY